MKVFTLVYLHFSIVGEKQYFFSKAKSGTNYILASHTFRSTPL